MNSSKFDMSKLPKLLYLYLPLVTISLSILYQFYLIKHTKKPKPCLNLPPSPTKLPIIGNLHQLGNLPHQALWQLSQNISPVMLLAFGTKPTLIVSSAAMAKEILKTHDLDFCSRPNSSGPKRLTYDFLDSAFTPYNDHWKAMRKIFVSELLSPKRAPQLQKTREMEIGKLINSLSLRSGSCIDLDKELCCLVDAIVSVVAFGNSHKEKFNGKELKDVFGEAMVILDGFSARDFLPWNIGRIVELISGEKRRLDECFKQLDGYFQMVLDEHLEKLKHNKLGHDSEDLADSLIRRMLNGERIGGTPLTKNHIKACFLNTFLGGVDTSSVAVAWAMSELIKNSRVMQKLQAEIRNLVPNKTKVQEAHLLNLTYLKMAVKETLRLHPSDPLLIPHESIRQTNIGGYDILPKTMVLINAWGIGRDANSWENPYEFFPERFEDNNIDFRGQNFELIPFGAGRRVCPGINMAIATIELTLANLLHRFDWEVPSGMKMEDISMEEKRGIVVRRKVPLCLVPIKVSGSLGKLV